MGFAVIGLVVLFCSARVGTAGLTSGLAWTGVSAAGSSKTECRALESRSWSERPDEALDGRAVGDGMAELVFGAVVRAEGVVLGLVSCVGDAIRGAGVALAIGLADLAGLAAGRAAGFAAGFACSFPPKIPKMESSCPTIVRCEDREFS